MTPFQIEIIMHHNHSLADFPRRAAPLYGPTRDDLITNGILEANGNAIITTERGRAYCAMLCATPLPVSAWRDPRDDKPIDMSGFKGN